MLPSELFQGRLMVAAPHMDDEALACGGTLAGLADKTRLEVVYATDGTRSPVPPGKAARPELAAIRQEEARAAMAQLGIEAGSLHFLGLPDGRLISEQARLRRAIEERIKASQPDFILAPFRYDRHPDHLALYRAVMRAVEQTRTTVQVYEYFVYYRYRLVQGGDLRQYLRPELRLDVDIRAWSGMKKAALEQYRSQTTLFYEWQQRPILPSQRVEEVSRGPEMFLKVDPRYPGGQVFSHQRAWLLAVHALEPRLKEAKERLAGLLKGQKKAHDGR